MGKPLLPEEKLQCSLRRYEKETRRADCSATTQHGNLLYRCGLERYWGGDWLVKTPNENQARASPEYINPEAMELAAIAKTVQDILSDLTDDSPKNISIPTQTPYKASED